MYGGARGLCMEGRGGACTGSMRYPSTASCIWVPVSYVSLFPLSKNYRALWNCLVSVFGAGGV